MDMAALAQVNHQGQRRHDQWGKGPPSRGNNRNGSNDEEDGLIEECGAGTTGRDGKGTTTTIIMRKRPRSPTTTTYPLAQGNKPELGSVPSTKLWHQNSADRTTTTDHPRRIHSTKISHSSHSSSSSGPTLTGTRTTSGSSDQETNHSMCQNFQGRRDSENMSATGRGLPVPLRPPSPNSCHTWDRRLRSPERGRDAPIPSRPFEPTPTRDRDSLERRLSDNDRNRYNSTSQPYVHRREEPTGSSRGHFIGSGGSWNDTNRTRNDSAPRFEPRQGHGVPPTNRNAPEEHYHSQPIRRHENARAREEVSRVNERQRTLDYSPPPPGHFPPAEDRYEHRRGEPERPTGNGASHGDFYHSSHSQVITTSRRDFDQGRYPERGRNHSFDDRPIPPTRRDHDSGPHPPRPERRTSYDRVNPLPRQNPDNRFHHGTNARRYPSTKNADSYHQPGRDNMSYSPSYPTPRPRPTPVSSHPNSGPWQRGDDHEPWRPSESVGRDISHSNKAVNSVRDQRPEFERRDFSYSKSGPDQRPSYEKTSGGQRTRSPDSGRFSDTRTSTFTSSLRSPGRDQWNRQESQFCPPERHGDSRQHVQPTDNSFDSINARRSPGRDTWYPHERQTSHSMRDLDLKQNCETMSYAFLNPATRSDPDKMYRHDNRSCDRMQPRSNLLRSDPEPMPRMRRQGSPSEITTSFTTTSTSATPAPSMSPQGYPAVHGKPLDSRPFLQDGNDVQPTRSQQYEDRSGESRKREATEEQNLNVPDSKRWCNITRDTTKSGSDTPPSSTSVPRQSNEASTTDSSMNRASEKEKSNPIVSIANRGISATTEAATTASTKTAAKCTSESLPAKKTSIGIPMRWLKPPPPKPKIVPKAKSKETSTLTKNVNNESKKEEPAPSSPLLNRTVTDSEGGSTVSNTRELLAMVEKKTKQPQVPTAIVTMKTVEDTSMDSPPHTAGKSKGSSARNAKAGTKVALSLDRDDTDDEPPLESDDDDDSSIDSSSDESDTDDEEVMLWASKMFGVPLPSSKAPSSQSSINEMNSEDQPTISRKPLKLRLKLSASKILPGTPSSASFHQQNKFADDERMSYKKTKALQAELCAEENNETLVDVPMRLAVRGRRKKKKSLLKKLPDITPEERQIDLEQERMEREEEKRIREEAKPLTAAQIREILGEDVFEGASSSNWVRRSVRQPSRALLNSKPLKALVDGLKNNDPDMVVLKMKKYINDPNAPSVVLDAALEALEENTNCEALYIQNFNEGMRDKQVLHLLRILQSSTCKIWCLNIGENYNVDTETWDKFTKGLRRTKITHMYASEHTITTEMKDEIRETIRENRSKHDMHINPNNLDVIIQCTHCWWNPINAKALRPYLKKKGYEHILNDKEAQGLRGSTSEAPSA